MDIAKKLKGKGFIVTLNDLTSEKHLDSFWYDGVVLRFKDMREGKMGQEYAVEAVGDIEIFSRKTWNIVFDNGGSRNEGFGRLKITEDKHLKKICEENGLVWEHNNWFDVRKVKPGDLEFYDMGHVIHEIPALLDLIKEGYI